MLAQQAFGAATKILEQIDGLLNTPTDSLQARGVKDLIQQGAGLRARRGASRPSEAAWKRGECGGSNAGDWVCKDQIHAQPAEPTIARICYDDQTSPLSN